MNEAIVDIPDALPEITPEWLTAALGGRYPGVVVVDCEVSGFLGYKPNKACVSLRYNATGRGAGLPETMIVKGGFKRDGGGQTLSGLDLGLELELLAYKELTEHLDARTPYCHFVHFDPARYDGIMLIEDLAPQGAVFFEGASVPQARRVCGVRSCSRPASCTLVQQQRAGRQRTLRSLVTAGRAHSTYPVSIFRPLDGGGALGVGDEPAEGLHSSSTSTGCRVDGRSSCPHEPRVARMPSNHRPRR